MIRAAAVRPAGSWTGQPADRVTLAYDDRNRRRFAMLADGGLAFLLDMPAATLLRHGDGLVLEDGRIVEVRARPEPLLAIRARDAQHLVRLAWHLGNRHVPAALEPSRLLIRPDHVIAAMLVGLGADVSAIDAPFDPEGGAYDGQAAPMGETSPGLGHPPYSHHG